MVHKGTGISENLKKDDLIKRHYNKDQMVGCKSNPWSLCWLFL